MLSRCLRRYGWTNTHLIGCVIIIIVLYKVWYSVLDDNQAGDSQLDNAELGFNKRDSANGLIMKKAAYRYDRYANRDKENVGSPGERGVAVQLTGKDKALADSLFKKEAFNIIASNRIALNRTLKDIRDPA